MTLEWGARLCCHGAAAPRGCCSSLGEGSLCPCVGVGRGAELWGQGKGLGGQVIMVLGAMGLGAMGTGSYGAEGYRDKGLRLGATGTRGYGAGGYRDKGL